MEDMRSEALIQGIEQGIKQGMKEAALRMLNAGKYALDEIANISGLSLEEVNQLKQAENDEWVSIEPGIWKGF